MSLSGCSDGIVVVLPERKRLKILLEVVGFVGYQSIHLQFKQLCQMV